MSLVKSHIKNRVTNVVNKITNQEQQKFYQRHNQCCLCKSELSVEVKPVLANEYILEKVSCKKCSVTVSTSEHPLN